MSSGLQCVGVIGPTNAPLHVTTYGDAANDANAFLHTLHCALDEVELRGGGGAGASGSGDANSTTTATHGQPSPQPQSSQITKDPFLGLILPTESYKVYAYKTNTRAVFLLVYDDTVEVGEVEIRSQFKKIQDAYSNAMSNPFAERNKRIESKLFLEVMQRL